MNRFIPHIDSLVREMITHRQSSGVDHTLIKCRTYAKGGVTCSEQSTEYEKQMDRAADGVIPRKIDDLFSWMFDIISNSFDSLFTVRPTSVVSLSRTNQDKVIDTVERTLFQLVLDRRAQVLGTINQEAALQGVQLTEDQAIQIAESRGIRLNPSSKGVTEIAKRLKGVAMSFENELAKKGALTMKTEIQDIIDETNYVDQILAWLRDYCEFPYAVLRDYVTIEKRRAWRGDKWVQEEIETPMIRRVSPFDFFWTQDSTTTQDGTGIAERIRLNKGELLKLARINGQGYNADAIEKFVSEMVNGHRDWLVEHEEDEEVSTWGSTETVDVFRTNMRIMGKKLIDYHYDDHDALLIDVDEVEPNKQYEIEVMYANEHALQLIIRRVDCIPRPYHVEKYIHINGRFHGQSLCEVLEPVELKARAVDRRIIENMGYISDPIVMVDESQLADDHGLDLRDRLEPGTLVPIAPIPGATNAPITIITFPDNLARLRQYRLDLDERADMVSGIPRFAVGDTSNMNSALRSANLVTLMLSNARRTLKVRLLKISRNVLVPSIEHHFSWYMDHGENEDAKIDSDVVIGSIDAILNKDFVIPQIQNIIQYLSGFAGSGDIPQDTIKNLLDKLLFELGIDNGAEDSQIQEAVNSAVDQLILPNPGNPLPAQLDQRSPIDLPTQQGLPQQQELALPQV